MPRQMPICAISMHAFDIAAAIAIALLCHADAAACHALSAMMSLMFAAAHDADAMATPALPLLILRLAALMPPMPLLRRCCRHYCRHCYAS